MNDDLIRRSDVIDELMHIIPYRRYHNGAYVLLLNKRECLKVIRAVPSINKPQGKWIDKGDYAECSNCGADSGTQFDGVETVPWKTKFCYNCGARMEGADDEV